MKKNYQPQIGDKIIVLDSDEPAIVGEKGLVTDIKFIYDTKLYSIDWEDESLVNQKLSVIDGVDIVMVLNTPTIKENFPARSPEDFYINNAVLIKSFGLLNQYVKFFEQLRKSGVVNMLTNGIPNLIWMGKDQIDDAFPKSQTRDNEEFQVLLDMADEMRMKMINGTVKYVERNIIPKNPDADELELVNRYIKKISDHLYRYFLGLYGRY